MTHLPSFFSDARGRRAAGFSLVEVTLALGIVTFALVGAVGVLPTAVSSGRKSINENRAAAIAETVFASFRSQPFQSVCYLDAQYDANGQPTAAPSPAPLDFNANTQSATTTAILPDGTKVSGVLFYATMLDGFVTGDPANTFGNMRHLQFEPAQVSQSGNLVITRASDYLVVMNFNNQPDGTVVTPQASSPLNAQPVVPAQANRVDLVILEVSRMQDQFHFETVIANRTN